MYIYSYSLKAALKKRLNSLRFNSSKYQVQYVMYISRNNFLVCKKVNLYEFIFIFPLHAEDGDFNLYSQFHESTDLQIEAIKFENIKAVNFFLSVLSVRLRYGL